MTQSPQARVAGENFQRRKLVNDLRRRLKFLQGVPVCSQKYTFRLFSLTSTFQNIRLAAGKLFQNYYKDLCNMGLRGGGGL